MDFRFSILSLSKIVVHHRNVMVLIALGFLTGPTICIDPGHPSEVGRGTQGKHVTEMQVAWDVSLALKTKLQSLGYEVVLTKKKLEEKVLNKRRAEIANEAHAALMVRLHCDASSDSGFAVYYPTQQGNIDGFRGPEVSLLKTIAPLAQEFHAAMSSGLKGLLKDQGLKSDLKTAVGAQHGALVGSIYSKVPVVLVEMVVLTNPKDEAFIVSKAGRAAMVGVLADGVLAAVPLR